MPSRASAKQPRTPSEQPPTPPEDAPGPSGTKLQILEAALQTLKTKGFAGASARAIAAEGGFNQALIFYHFGSVRNLLLAVFDLISERRMSEYGPAFEQAWSASELVALAHTIYRDDLERGYITVLGEMVSGGVTDAELGAAVAARIEPWIEMVERKLRQMLTGTPLQLLASPRDIAFALVALYFGVDMLSHLQRDQTRAQSLLDLGASLAVVVDTILPARPEETP
jgi:AcrR family transcriptional regulator